MNRAAYHLGCSILGLAAAVGVIVAPSAVGQEATGLPPGPAPTASDPFDPYGPRKRRGITQEPWQAWWILHRHELIAAHLRRPRPGTSTPGSSAFLTGLGGKGVGAARPPSRRQVEETILPVLRGAFLTAREPELVRAAAIALGRAAVTDPAVIDELVSRFDHPSLDVRSVALLSFGRLAELGAAPLLLEILDDTKEGRELLGYGRSPIGGAERGLAAVLLIERFGDGLGPALFERLRAWMESWQVKEGAPGSARFALGVIRALGGVGEQSDEAAVSLLRSTLRQEVEGRRPQVRAALDALARLGSRAEAVVPDLVERVRDRKVDPEFRVRAVEVLGRVADPEDRNVRDLLRELARRHEDGAIRHAAWMSLAELGARGVAEARSQTPVSVEELLASGSDRDRASRLLATAWLLRSESASSVTRAAAAARVADQIERAGQRSLDGVRAVTLGLLGGAGDSVADRVLDRLEAMSDPARRAELALGLGLLQHKPALPVLSEALADEMSGGSQNAVTIAIAVAQIDPKLGGEALLDLLRSARHPTSAAEAARALAQFGGRGVVDELAELVRRRALPPWKRAAACEALGRLAGRIAATASRERRWEDLLGRDDFSREW